MKKYLLMAGTLLSSMLFAQTVQQSNLKLTVGPTLGSDEGSNLWTIGNPSEGLVGIRTADGGYSINRLSSSYAVTSTDVVKIKDLGSDVWRNQFVTIGDKAFYFYDNRGKTFQFGALVIDAKAAKKDDIKILLDKPALAFRPTEDGILFDMAFSSDSSKILVGYRYPAKSKDDKTNYDVVGVHVYDNKLNLLWNKDITLPYTEVMMDNRNFGVDKDGNAYLLAKVFATADRKEKTKDGAANYRYELLRMSQSSSTIKKTPIELGEFVNSSMLMESPLGGMLAIGFYSDYPKITTSNGAFVARIDKEGNLQSGKTKYEFPESVLSLNRSVTGKDVNFVTLRQVIPEKDGNLLIVGEGYESVSNGNATMYYHGDIFLMKIGADNDMHWCKGIRKLQAASVYKQYFGLGVLPYKGGYYVFYTDNPLNFNKSQNEMPERMILQEGWLVYNKINADGTMDSKKKLFDIKSAMGGVDPDMIVLLGGNKAVMKGYDKKSQRLLTLELE